MEFDYYSNPYVSNSDLSKFKSETNPPAFQLDFSKALSFGKLLHAVILEPHTVDFIALRVGDESFTADDLALAKAMRQSFFKDPFCQNLWTLCQKEVEMFDRATSFTHNGQTFTMPTRRKYDLWNSMSLMGGDIKSTTAITQDAFLKAVQEFDYDRSRVFYAKSSNAQRDVIIGISKKPPHKLFPVFMRPGCPLWKSGEEKCNSLAYQYWALKPTV